MGRRKCRVILTLMVAGSIALTGCKKEAEQIVSKPLDTVKGAAVVASPSPSPTVRYSPTPSPTSDTVVAGEGEQPLWTYVVSYGMILLVAGVLGYAAIVGDPVDDAAVARGLVVDDLEANLAKSRAEAAKVEGAGK